MPAGSITLAQVAALTPTLNIACDRCTRAGRYRLDKLIAQHGRDFGIPGVLALLSTDCPKRHSVSAYDLCGINCPDLPSFFLKQRGLGL